MSEDAQWEYMFHLTRAVMDLAGALLPLVNDVKALGKLQPFYDELRTLNELYAQNYRSEPVETGPSTAELHSRISDLEQHRRDREADSKRPVHITIRRDKKEKQNEKA